MNIHRFCFRCVQPVCFMLLALLTATPAAFSQVKYEREIRIRPAAAPAPARAFAAAALGAQKVRWYQEINLDFFSYEAKVKKDGRCYSIEFDSSGRIQDVEIEVKFSSLNTVLRQKIDATLSGLFSGHKITKTQLQWTGAEPALRDLLRSGDAEKSYTERVEIVFKCREAGKPKLYEALFDITGKLLSKLEIVPRNTDNLDY